jgi:hypothetical protein
MPVKLPPSSNRLEGTGTGLETWLGILLVHLRQRERLPRCPLLYKASNGAKMCHGADEKGNPSKNSIGTANRRSQTDRCREAATAWLPVSQRQESCWICVRGYRRQTCRIRSTAEFRPASLFRGSTSPRKLPTRKKARNRGGSGLFVPVAKKAIRRRLRQLWSALRSSPMRLP